MEDKEKGGKIMPQSTSDEPTFKTEDITKTKAGSHDQAKQFTQVHESKASKVRKKTHVVVEQHHKIIILVLIAVVLVVVAAAMLVVAIPQWTKEPANTESAQQENSDSNDQTVQQTTVPTDAELQASVVSFQSLPYTELWEYFTANYPNNKINTDELKNKYDDAIQKAQSDSERAQLYYELATLLDQALAPNSAPRHQDIISYHKKAYELNPSAEMAYALYDFADVYGYRDLANEYYALFQKHYQEKLQSNRKGA